MSDCSRHAFDVPELPGCPFCGGETRIRRYGDGRFSFDMYHEKGCIMLEDLENGFFDPGDFDSMIGAWCARAERTCREVRTMNVVKGGVSLDCAGWACSECGYSQMGRLGNHCPQCGAKVVG